jgi:hypothetical protein
MALYTLKDIKQSTYDRMFLEPSEYSEYDAFFVTAINDAFMELCKRFSVAKQYEIDKSPSTDNPWDTYDMIDLTMDEITGERIFMSFAENSIYKLTEDGIIPFNNYFTSLDQYLCLPAEESGSFLVLYNAYPHKITDITPDNYEIEFEPEICQYLPMLCAWRLFLDDDISRATMYYNEYVQSVAENVKPPQMGTGIRIREGYDL